MNQNMLNDENINSIVISKKNLALFCKIIICILLLNIASGVFYYIEFDVYNQAGKLDIHNRLLFAPALLLIFWGVTKAYKYLSERPVKYKLISILGFLILHCWFLSYAADSVWILSNYKTLLIEPLIVCSLSLLICVLTDKLFSKIGKRIKRERLILLFLTIVLCVFSITADMFDLPIKEFFLRYAMIPIRFFAVYAIWIFLICFSVKNLLTSNKIDFRAASLSFPFE